MLVLQVRDQRLAGISIRVPRCHGTYGFALGGQCLARSFPLREGRLDRRIPLRRSSAPCSTGRHGQTRHAPHAQVHGQPGCVHAASVEGKQAAAVRAQQECCVIAAKQVPRGLRVRLVANLHLNSSDAPGVHGQRHDGTQWPARMPAVAGGHRHGKTREVVRRRAHGRPAVHDDLEIGRSHANGIRSRRLRPHDDVGHARDVGARLTCSAPEHAERKVTLQQVQARGLLPKARGRVGDRHAPPRLAGDGQQRPRPRIPRVGREALDDRVTTEDLLRLDRRYGRPVQVQPHRDGIRGQLRAASRIRIRLRACDEPDRECHQPGPEDQQYPLHGRRAGCEASGAS